MVIGHYYIKHYQSLVSIDSGPVAVLDKFKKPAKKVHTLVPPGLSRPLWRGFRYISIICAVGVVMSGD